MDIAGVSGGWSFRWSGEAPSWATARSEPRRVRTSRVELQDSPDGLRPRVILSVRRMASNQAVRGCGPRR
jgi:hypothetical protein